MVPPREESLLFAQFALLIKKYRWISDRNEKGRQIAPAALLQDSISSDQLHAAAKDPLIAASPF
jgi:hypothetical protein